MRLTRWLNPMLPQTLQYATILFYLNAGFDVLFGVAFTPIGFLVTLGSVFAGLGIANSFKWGYRLAVFVAALGLVPFVLLVLADGIGALLTLGALLALIFPVALFALVVHPESRNYQRIWFE